MFSYLIRNSVIDTQKPLSHSDIIGAMLARHKTIANLLNNSRFYILVGSTLFAIIIMAWLRLRISSQQLYYIRLEQIFGLLSIVYLYVAVIISPLSKLVGEKGGMRYLLFGRRAIGVMAACFAVLHSGVALLGQIGGISGINLLPDRFKWSISLGLTACIILIAMAATSFDKVVSYMTLERWKWLHRLVYMGIIFIILHVWMIGTHLAYFSIKVSAFIALALFFGLEANRIVHNAKKKIPALQVQQRYLAAVFCIWMFWISMLVWMPNLVNNYHAEHYDQQGNHGTQN